MAFQEKREHICDRCGKVEAAREKKGEDGSCAYLLPLEWGGIQFYGHSLDDSGYKQMDLCPRCLGEVRRFARECNEER